MSVFSEQVGRYDEWRRELADAVRRYARWLQDNELYDASVSARLDRVQDRLGNDRTSIAFVAEFSRGKSELINALFFSDHRERVVPSSAGRTTMCPTELLYDAEQSPSIRLLPIETRLEEQSLTELRDRDDTWHRVAIDPTSHDSLRAAFGAVQQTIRVDVDRARQLGFVADDEDLAAEIGEDGRLDVPRWRHAIVNYPHPLLEMGLVIIDTPGLNAIGTEPELTLSMIPGADAVLFVLAADAGVTRTDIDVWRRHVNPTHDAGRLVVLNKIDGLWDELKGQAQVDAEISRQVTEVSRLLDLPADRVYPVSAQKGLVARVTRDPELLERSRLVDLEQAISTELLPRRKAILLEHVGRDFDDVAQSAASLLASRRRSVLEQVQELKSLRGKNHNVMNHMAGRIRNEREEFDKSLRHLQGLRSVFARHSQAIFTTIGADSLRRHVRESREAMRGSSFSTGLRGGMDSLVESVRADFGEANRLCAEIGTLMSAMYKTFSTQHGLALGTPMLFSMRRYLKEIDRIEALQRRQFGAVTMATTAKQVLVRRFFESVAARVKQLYEVANRDIQAWLRAVMAPIEGQIREHQAQLKHRLDAVRRVIDASDSLEDRIIELERDRAEAEQRLALCDEFVGQVREAMAPSEQAEESVPA